MRAFCGIVGAFVGLSGFVFIASGGSAEPGRKIGPDPRQWDRTVEKAISYLKTTQA